MNKEFNTLERNIWEIAVEISKLAFEIVKASLKEISLEQKSYDFGMSIKLCRDVQHIWTSVEPPSLIMKVQICTCITPNSA